MGSGGRLEVPFVRSTALFVGIDAYGNGLPRLRTAANDATDLATLFASRLDFETTTLLDQAATSAGISNALAVIAAEHTDADRLVFYFAGHGFAYDQGDGPRGFLAPVGATLNDHGSYLPMGALYEQLARVRCRHLLVILDCCFAGAFRWGGHTRDLGAGPERLYRQRFDRYVQRPARQLLVSADYDERALDEWAPGSRDGESGRNSPFATALLRGLRGDADAQFEGAPKDGVITATELYVFCGPPSSSSSSRRTRRHHGYGHSNITTAGSSSSCSTRHGPRVSVLPVSSSALAALACRRLPRNLLDTEWSGCGSHPDHALARAISTHGCVNAISLARTQRLLS